MEQLVTIKQEPEWSMNDDEYSSAQLYKAEPNISFTEYEIRPYYDGDIDFDYIKCKVGFCFYKYIKSVKLYDILFIDCYTYVRVLELIFSIT